MNDKECKEELLDFKNSCGWEYAREVETALQHAITLMEDLERIEGVLPKEKDVYKQERNIETPEDLELLTKSKGFNQAIDEVKLHLLKNFSVERIEKTLESIAVGNHDDNSEYIIPGFLFKPITQAIHALIGGKE